MDNFDEYLRQGEPNKKEKAEIWKIAIGLQQVDGLKPSAYLIATAKQNIDGDISIEEVKQRVDSYYKQQPSHAAGERTEEADKVSARITEILSEKTFSFSAIEYLTIHRRLFRDIYPHAGKIREFNISKKEWILNEETILYGSAEGLKETLNYDIQQEKQFSYKGLSLQEIIAHIAYFIAYLWQIHVFEEGNTRTTAIFLIKYLRSLGFKEVNNDLFATYSWYFRNTLVRANYQDLSKGIYRTDKYLIHFLSNLLLGENHLLSNRKMHIHYNEPINEPIKPVNEPIKDTIKEPIKEPINDAVFSLIKQNNKITAAEISKQLLISLSTAKREIKTLKVQGMLERIGSNKTGHWQIIEK